MLLKLGDMGNKLVTGTRDEKIEAATNIAMCAAALGLTLSTVTLYSQPFLSHAIAPYVTDDTAALVGFVVGGAISALKFT